MVEGLERNMHVHRDHLTAVLAYEPLLKTVKILFSKTTCRDCRIRMSVRIVSYLDGLQKSSVESMLKTCPVKK